MLSLINSVPFTVDTADETLFDFETNPEIIGTVDITDGVLSTGACTRITLNDVEEFENATFWRGERITFTKEDSFEPFRSAVEKPSDVVGKDLVMHLITDDIYIEVNFLSWSSGKLGGFSYQRTTE